MIKQIKRLSPHQNGKVFGIISAVGSLLFVVPMTAIMFFALPSVDRQGNPVTFQKYIFILFPILYLVFGYVMTTIGCMIYNFFFKYIGGFEYETKDNEVSNSNPQF
jgi:quinol-cytochrome oxidoreductase complex cytochrome b subunit